MTIIGFNFTKILAEKTALAKGKVNINNKVKIQEVEKASLTLAKNKQPGIKFTFVYTSKYEPNVGNVELIGDLLFVTDDKEAKSIIDEWDKNKKLPEKIMPEILNTVLQKCNIQALLVSKDVNLPPSVPMPKVQIKQ